MFQCFHLSSTVHQPNLLKMHKLLELKALQQNPDITRLIFSTQLCNFRSSCRLAITAVVTWWSQITLQIERALQIACIKRLKGRIYK